MISEKRTHLAEATALNTGAAGTYLIGSQIDTGAPTLKDLGAVEDLFCVIRVHTAPTSAGGALTLTFKLASDATAAVHVSTSTVHVVTPTFAEATLVAGYEYAFKLPAGSYEQFLGLLQVTAGEAATAGKIDCFLTTDYRTNVIYPAAW